MKHAWTVAGLNEMVTHFRQRVALESNHQYLRMLRGHTQCEPVASMEGSNVECSLLWGVCVCACVARWMIKSKAARTRK